MAEQRHGARFAELKTQPTDPLAWGSLPWHLVRNIRRWNDHVVSEVRPAHATTAAAIERTVRYDGGGEGALKILRKPGFVDAGVDVIPGEGLGAERGQVFSAQRIGSPPTTEFKLAVTAFQSGRGDRIGPGAVGAIEGLEPGIHPSTGAPGRLDDRSQSAIATAYEVLHRREPHIREVEAHASKGTAGLTKQLLTARELSGRHAVPLERGMGLGREITDRDVELQTAEITAALLEHCAGFGDAKDIGIGFSRQTDHEIELHLAVTVLHRSADPVQQVLIGQTLVDDVAETLGSGLRRERQSRLATSPENVGDVVIKAIHPLAGELQGDVLIRKSVAKLDPDSRQSQIVTAAERQEREVAVTGPLHARFHRLNHGLRLHIPGRAGQHPRLTETASPRAAPSDFNREPVMDRLHMGNQPHGVMGHRRRHTSQGAGRQLRVKRLHSDPVNTRGIQGRHVHTRHVGQIPQQTGTGPTRGLGFSDHKTDLGQQLLPIPESDEIKEGGVGLGVAGGRWSASEDQWRRLRVAERSVTPITGPQWNPSEIEHFEDVGRPELVAETESKDVECWQRAPALNGKQWLIALAQARGKVCSRQIGPVTQLARNGVQDRIKNDVAEIARPDLVNLRIGEGPAHTGRRPVARFNAELMPHVTGRSIDAFIHQAVEIDRLQTRARNGHGSAERWPHRRNRP